MPLQRGLVKDDRFTAVYPTGMAHENAREAVGADNIHLTPFHREQDVDRAAVATNKLELRTGIGVERSREQNCGGAATGRADIVLFRTNVFERCDAGLCQRSTGINVGYHAPDIG